MSIAVDVDSPFLFNLPRLAHLLMRLIRAAVVQQHPICTDRPLISVHPHASGVIRAVAGVIAAARRDCITRGGLHRRDPDAHRCGVKDRNVDQITGMLG
jgi:hypothetical protein